MWYIAMCAVAGEVSWLGVYDTEPEAIKAADDWLADRDDETIVWVQSTSYVNLRNL